MRRATCYHRMQQIKLCIKDLQKAQEIDPEDKSIKKDIEAMQNHLLASSDTGEDEIFEMSNDESNSDSSEPVLSISSPIME